MSNLFASIHDIDTRLIDTLIETLKDGEAGFRAAADDVSNVGLKSIFHHYSGQRHQFASELQKFVVQEGETPETGGTLAGAAHRGWMSIKATVAMRADNAVLEECERGEDSAIATFHDALMGGKLGGAADSVSRQINHIREAHQHVRALRNQYRSHTA